MKFRCVTFKLKNALSLFFVYGDELEDRPVLEHYLKSHSDIKFYRSKL